MELNDFVGIHHESGFSLKKVNGNYFLNRGWINYSFPQLVSTPVNGKLIRMLKWRYPISVIKIDSRIKNTYEYILHTDEYDLDSFRKRTRTTVRKSLHTCEFKRPSFEDLINHGLTINRQTLKLQNRNDKFLTDEKRWEKYISLFYHQADSKILGAYMEGKMIGFAIAYRLEGKYYFHIQHIDRNYATYYPMSGLMYKIVNQIITEDGTIEISDGIESFNPMPTLNRFKRYMRFERVPITRVYVIHPFLIALFKPIVFYYVRLLGKRTIKNPHLRQIIDLYHGYRVLSRIMG